jgi:hypothetical protein
VPSVTFEDTGTHDFWQIVPITSSCGVTAYVAQVVEADDALDDLVEQCAFLGTIAWRGHEDAEFLYHGASF